MQDYDMLRLACPNKEVADEFIKLFDYMNYIEQATEDRFHTEVARELVLICRFSEFVIYDPDANRTCEILLREFADLFNVPVVRSIQQLSKCSRQTSFLFLSAENNGKLIDEIYKKTFCKVFCFAAEKTTTIAPVSSPMLLHDVELFLWYAARSRYLILRNVAECTGISDAEARFVDCYAQKSAANSPLCRKRPVFQAQDGSFEELTFDECAHEETVHDTQKQEDANQADPCVPATPAQNSAKPEMRSPDTAGQKQTNHDTPPKSHETGNE
jgi:hypothetical protein